MSDVIYFKKRLIVVHTINYSVTSYAMGAIASQIADEFVADVRVGAKTVDRGPNQPLEFRW
jgi:hypothetical protein